MPKCSHKFAPAGQRHALHNWEVPTADDLATVAPGKCDQYKIALVLEDNVLYMLTLLEPLTWKRLGSGPPTLRIAADISERDSIIDTVPVLCLVRDASADSTVVSGAALYIWEPADPTGSWTKVAEYESMDLNFVVYWDTVDW